MNLIYRLQNNVTFTTSEKYIAEYILAHNVEVLKISTVNLGKATYTSPATIVRFCQKLNFNGFDDFKIQFARDYNESMSQSHSVDYNYPFSSNSSIKEVIKNLTIIEQKTIEEMQYLLDENDIARAVDYIQKASSIEFYGYGTSLIAALEFEFLMNRIDKNVHVARSTDSLLGTAIRSDESHLAIIVSYSGVTKSLVQIAELLKENGTPIISITSNTENQIKKLCNLNFSVPSRESLYSKIGTFSSTTSLKFVLDIFYAAIYKEQFEKNTNFLLENARKIETRRNSQLNN